jgi:uncharacterized HAD superfamily protein
MRRRIGVDIDGVLCVGEHWRDPQACLQAVAIQNGIDRVNKLYKTDFIILYTARQNYLISATLEWLEKNNVHFHAISNHKIPLDCLIDDVKEP